MLIERKLRRIMSKECMFSLRGNMGDDAPHVTSVFNDPILLSSSRVGILYL